MIRFHRLISGRGIGDDGADRHFSCAGQLHLGIADAEDAIGIDIDTSNLKTATLALETDGRAIAADIRDFDGNWLALGVRRGPSALPLRRIDIGKFRAGRNRYLCRSRIGRLQNAEDVGRGRC